MTERSPASNAPRLAAFPKAWMHQLCRTGELSLDEWLDMAVSLEVDGVELYGGMLDLADRTKWPFWREQIDRRGLSMPMLCCSPDFTVADPTALEQQIEREIFWIDMAAALGGQFCRVLSGQRRPNVSDTEGLDRAAAAITACLPHAADRGITLTLENHYKDSFWTYPEFAQRADLFCALVDRVDRSGFSNFGVNFDPSNALLAGEDPVALLERVRHRVVTMHASDRYLLHGTLDDLRREERTGGEGYARRLHHGEIGRGVIDYPTVLSLLHDAGFSSWISIEDGVDGFEQLQRSVAFMRRAMAAEWDS